MKIDFLLKRAQEFLETAEYHFSNEKYHLVAFDLEQASQLMLKHALFKKLRHFPPTHSLKELLRAVGKAWGREKEIEKFGEKNVHLIADLEQAYISSRYLPAEFSRKQVEELKEFVKKLEELLNKL
ncbi:MAG: HEPN domain-containing protein [Microgenomates group bacterium]